MTTTKAELHRSQRATAIIGLAAVVILVSFTLWFVTYNQDQADRRWCELIVSIDERNAASGNTDPEAVRFQAQIHEIRESLPCEGVPIPNPKAP